MLHYAKHPLTPPNKQKNKTKREKAGFAYFKEAASYSLLDLQQKRSF